MKRELYALLSNDSKDCPPIIQTNAIPGGYKQKVKLGQRKTRSWRWVRFNPDPKFHKISFLSHWRRMAEEGKEYPFARFNKKIPIPQYTFQEYQQKIQCDDWNKEESDYLLTLCKQFDLRFPVSSDCPIDIEQHPIDILPQNNPITEKENRLQLKLNEYSKRYR